MTEASGLRLHEVVIDAADPRRLADFWSEALGWRELDTESDDEGLILVELGPPAASPAEGGPTLVFLRNPDVPSGKNRLHLDLAPQTKAEQLAQVERLEALGARRTDIGQGPDVSWVVLSDPEGNVFCVLQPRT